MSYIEDTGSWVATAFVLTSILISWAMNYSNPRIRVFGTFLAALGCLSVSMWFFSFVMPSGILENPKPNQAPMDSAKPIFLWIQALIALFSGIFLLAIAKQQSKNNNTLNLESKNEATRFGLVSRFLHWTIAILFISLIPLGIFASMIPEDSQFRLSYYVLHKTIGVTLFLLVIIRICWNRFSKRPELDSSLSLSHAKLAQRAHLTLYFIMLAVPVTGFMMTSYHGYGTYFFFWEFASPVEESDVYIVWGLFHKYLLPYLIYIVLGAHILGALKHQFIDKNEFIIKRMIS
jgi:cytochrome b561